MAALHKWQNHDDISYNFLPLLQCKLSIVISSSYCPSLRKNWSSESLKQQKNMSSNLDAAGISRNYTPKGLLAIWIFFS